LYKTHIKHKPIIPTQKNATDEKEMEIFDDINDEELIEEDFNNCFTLTQNKNEDGLTFTERVNESQVFFSIYIQ
jgi:hypothetical protein